MSTLFRSSLTFVFVGYGNYHKATTRKHGTRQLIDAYDGHRRGADSTASPLTSMPASLNNMEHSTSPN